MCRFSFHINSGKFRLILISLSFLHFEICYRKWMLNVQLFIRMCMGHTDLHQSVGEYRQQWQYKQQTPKPLT